MNGWKKNGGFTSHLSVYFREIGGRNLRPPTAHVIDIQLE